MNRTPNFVRIVSHAFVRLADCFVGAVVCFAGVFDGRHSGIKSSITPHNICAYRDCLTLAVFGYDFRYLTAVCGGGFELAAKAERFGGYTYVRVRRCSTVDGNGFICCGKLNGAESTRQAQAHAHTFSRLHRICEMNAKKRIFSEYETHFLCCADDEFRNHRIIAL